MNLDTYSREYFPLWARNKNPALAEIRRGILYRGLSPDGARPVWIGAGMGPRLFYGREDGPFVPYDRTTIDQNENQKVSERKWPWCWGDEIWTLSTYFEQDLFFRFDPDGCDLLLVRPGISLLPELRRQMEQKLSPVPVMEIAPFRFVSFVRPKP